MVSAAVLDRSADPATRVHPAVRRRTAAQMPRAAMHEVGLRPLLGDDEKMVIVTSAAQDCVAALFDALSASDWQQRLEAMRRRRFDASDVLELNQPIHRRYQIALFEAHCARPGSPRLDPARIRGSGLVLRKVNADGGRRGWMKRGGAVQGWLPISQPLADPDPARVAAAHPANAAVQAALAAKRGQPQSAQPSETVHRLFVAPPEVCAATRCTVLFAVIPVASAETVDGAPPGIDYANLGDAERAQVVRHFSEYIGKRGERDMPRAGQAYDAGWNVLDPTLLDTTQPNNDPKLSSLGTFIHQVTVELGCGGDDEGPAASAFMRLLGEISLPTARDDLGRVTSSIDAASFVRTAARFLIRREDNPQDLAMPLSWPKVEDDLGTRLVDAALACLTEQSGVHMGPPGKFADEDALYTVNGFIRVAGHDDCPDRLVWSSTESEPFRILPWWDGDGPGTAISLPTLDKLKSVRPSVSFAMPPAIANLLNRDMKALVKGDDDKKADDTGLGWICSFSIPFITICAFIVLNIFLSLFDIIFRWMAFIKICIPVPKAK